MTPREDVKRMIVRLTAGALPGNNPDPSMAAAGAMLRTLADECDAAVADRNSSIREVSAAGRRQGMAEAERDAALAEAQRLREAITAWYSAHSDGADDATLMATTIALEAIAIETLAGEARDEAE